jgi:P-type Ca2+ transporter type 2C
MTPREGQENEPLLDERSRNNEAFKFKPEELGKLIDPKDPDLLKQYGGTKRILEGLRVDAAVGISSDEGLDTSKPKSKPFQERRKIYGENVSYLPNM